MTGPVLHPGDKIHLVVPGYPDEAKRFIDSIQPLYAQHGVEIVSHSYATNCPPMILAVFRGSAGAAGTVAAGREPYWLYPRRRPGRRVGVGR